MISKYNINESLKNNYSITFLKVNKIMTSRSVITHQLLKEKKILNKFMRSVLRKFVL